MGLLNGVRKTIGEIFSRAEEEPEEAITIRVREGQHAGMKLDYGWTAKPLTDFLYSKEEDLPPLVKVIIDVPKGVEKEDVKIYPVRKKLMVKIPKKMTKEIDLPFKVRDDYKLGLENNILVILLRRAEEEDSFGYGRG
jgi:HSP20 family molecular chaperone IbpA